MYKRRLYNRLAWVFMPVASNSFSVLQAGNHRYIAEYSEIVS